MFPAEGVRSEAANPEGPSSSMKGPHETRFMWTTKG